ncbi:MAG: hypothetical protein MUC36_19870 [Planctomycetes bacterium]|nr:hypothetical protein [Planctomycetota bacterium]
MGNAFWVRHRSLSGFVGPLTLEQLHQAVAAGSLPVDAEWREARSGGGPERLDDSGWGPVHELLGLPAPPPPASASGYASELPEAAALAELRANSAYQRVRQVAKWGAMVVAFAAALLLLVPLVTSWSALWRHPLAAVPSVLELILYEAGIYLSYQAFLMLADLADCSLRQRLEREAVATARP